MYAQAFAVVQLMLNIGKEWIRIEDIKEWMDDNEINFNQDQIFAILRDLIMMGTIEAVTSDEGLTYKVRIM